MNDKTKSTFRIRALMIFALYLALMGVFEFFMTKTFFDGIYDFLTNSGKETVKSTLMLISLCQGVIGAILFAVLLLSTPSKKVK